MRQTYTTDTGPKPPVFHPQDPSSNTSADTRELVSRLAFDQPGFDELTLKSVAEATGKSIDTVRSELQILRLERRITELESRPTVAATPDYVGRKGNVFVFLHSLRDAGFAGQIFMVCIGISAIIFAIFLGIAMISH